MKRVADYIGGDSRKEMRVSVEDRSRNSEDVSLQRLEELKLSGCSLSGLCTLVSDWMS